MKKIVLTSRLLFQLSAFLVSVCFVEWFCFFLCFFMMLVNVLDGISLFFFLRVSLLFLLLLLVRTFLVTNIRKRYHNYTFNVLFLFQTTIIYPPKKNTTRSEKQEWEINLALTEGICFGALCGAIRWS